MANAFDGARVGSVALSMGMALMLAACGSPEDGTGSIETRQSELEQFAGWNGIPNLMVRRGPVVAASDSVGTTMFALGTDNEVYETNSRDPGGFGGAWLRQSFFNDPSGFPNIGAAGFTQEPTGSALRNRFALAYATPEGLIRIKIQNQTGTSVIHDWDPIPGTAGFGFVALAWLPRNSISGSRRMLVLVAQKTQPDGFVYSAANDMSGGTYVHSRWSTLSGIPIPNGQLPNGPVHIAVTWACPRFTTDFSLVVAAGVFAPSGLGVELRFAKYNASAGGWGPWITAQSSTLFANGSMGLAGGCAEFNREVTLFGTGSPDSRIYVSTQITGGPASFSRVGMNNVFSSTARTMAGWSAGSAWVTAQHQNVAFYNRALSP